MYLINKQQHIAGLHHFGDDLLNTLLELTPVFGACHHTGQVQGHYPFVCYGFRHIAGRNHLGQTLYHGCLAHAGFANQTRVILSAAAQNLYHALDLLLPPYDRVQFSRCSQLGQVPAVAVQGRRGIAALSGPGSLKVILCGRGVLTHGCQQINIELLYIDPDGVEKAAGYTIPFPQHGNQNVLCSYLGCLKTDSLPVAVLYDTAGPGGIGRPVRGLYRWVGGDKLAHQFNDAVFLHSVFLQYLGRHSGPFLQQADEQMLCAHITMVQRLCHAHCQPKRFLGLWCISFHHNVMSSLQVC